MWPERVNDHTHASSAEIKIMQLHFHFLYHFMAWQLIKNRDKIAVYYVIIIILTIITSHMSLIWHAAKL